jgi:hypothetical protein
MTRHQVHGVTEPAPSYHVASAPNSSAILAVTVLAEIKDVLAVIRTAALLGNSFKASTLVDVMGEDAIYLESGENLSQASLESVLDSVQHKLSEYRSSQAPVFALEANITAASFLTAGTISVHIRSVASGPERPIIAR